MGQLVHLLDIPTIVNGRGSLVYSLLNFAVAIVAVLSDPYLLGRWANMVLRKGRDMVVRAIPPVLCVLLVYEIARYAIDIYFVGLPRHGLAGETTRST